MQCKRRMIISVFCLLFTIRVQWDTAPIMGKNSTPSLVGAGGLMERSGGAPKMPIQTQNTVSGTCTVAATVQESLWNLYLPLSLCRSLLLLGGAAPVEEGPTKIVAMEASRIFLCTPRLTQIIYLLEAKYQSWTWNLFLMGLITKSTGTYLFSITLTLRACSFMAGFFATFMCI